MRKLILLVAVTFALAAGTAAVISFNLRAAMADRMSC